MAKRHVVSEQFVQFGSIVHKLSAMIGTARDAFNRHQRQCLQDLDTLRAEAEEEVGIAKQRVAELLGNKSEDERQNLLKFHSIYSHQQITAETIANLSEPLNRKIKEGVLFSSKAVSETNSLFDHQLGIMQTFKDIVQTNDELLKNRVMQESDKLVEKCIEFATEHEARLVEGLCQPQAAPIYLRMLDLFQTVARHAREVARLLSDKSGEV